MHNIVWNDLILYLRDQKNCRIDGSGWFVRDLYIYLDKIEYLIEQHPENSRKNSVYCQCIKRQLRKVYEAHKAGNISEANVTKRCRFRHYEV